MIITLFPLKSVVTHRCVSALAPRFPQCCTTFTFKLVEVVQKMYFQSKQF